MSHTDLHDITLTMSGGNTITVGQKTADEVREFVHACKRAWDDPSAAGSASIIGEKGSDGLLIHINMRQIADVRTDVSI